MATAGSPVGTYDISASGAVDPNYSITYVDGTLTVSPAALTISADNQSKVYGAAVPTLTASYSGFVNGDTAASLTTAPTLSTTATADSPVGSYAISASGAVDPNYTISYVAGTLTVNQAATVTTVAWFSSTSDAVQPETVVSSGPTSVFGESGAITATVVPVAPGTGTPTGTVDFEAVLANGSTVTLGTGVLNSSGTTSISTSALAPGVYAVFAVYLGDSNFSTSTASQITLTINKADTSLVLSAGNTTVVSGQPISAFGTTLSAVSPGNFVAAPTGTITYYDTFNGVTTELAVTQEGGQGSFPALTAVGTHVLTAVYSGDSNYNGCTSEPLTVTVVA
jgi:hypothetical protein